MNCRNCAAALTASARFCARCGEGVELRQIRSLTPEFELLRRWRSLSQSMTRNEARKLFGEPFSVSFDGPPDAPTMEIWRFGYAAESHGSAAAEGLLRFLLPDGRLTSWAEPDWTLLQNPMA